MIQGQPVAGPLAPGQAYVLSSEGVVAPAAVVAPLGGSAPANGQVPAWNATSANWEPVTPVAPLGGSAPAGGQVPIWNGTNNDWEPGTIASGPGNVSFTRQSANFTLSPLAPYVGVDTSSGNITVTLPSANTYVGPPLTVKIVAGGSSIVLTAAGSDTIDAGPTTVITNLWQTLTVVVRADGLGWWLIHPQP
jgi:hypothetical protein